MARPVPKSASREEFLAALAPHLNPQEKDDLCRWIMNDASQAMQRLVQTRLQPNSNESRHSLTYSDFTETAIHREILNVYAHASPSLRPYYDLGRQFSDGNEENWVIRWAIYKSFRNSVNRGRTRTGGTGIAASRRGLGNQVASVAMSDSTTQTSPPESSNTQGQEQSQDASAPRRTSYWDPARNS